MNEEDFFYNAVAITLFGDRRSIGKAKQCSASWAEAYSGMLGRIRNGSANLFPSEKGMPKQPIPDPERSARELEDTGVRILLSTNPKFPKPLREIPHPPYAVYIKGDIPEARMNVGRTIAIVGTRRATEEGKTLARRFGATLSSAGFAITSGLAFGIDVAGHEGCLAAHGGPAIAVLAGGLAKIHPRNHEKLAGKILASGGALVSEYPLHEAPLSRRFIERNRLVSGLSQGVLVIEAPERSGALSTARFAFEQNRDIFVLPGGISQKNYRGSNRLIQQGAELITSPEDIFETYGMVIKNPPGKTAGYERHIAADGVLTPEERIVLEAIAHTEKGGEPPPDVDKISAMAKLEPRIVNQTLAFLIMKDIVKENADGFIMNNE